MRAVYGRRRTIPEAETGQKQSVHVRAMEGKSQPMRLGPSTVGSGPEAGRGRCVGARAHDEDQETKRELQGGVHLDRRDGFDGSSTNQAPGSNSDCVLQPVASYPDPIRGGDDVLVMCEVLLPDMTPHVTNSR